MSRNVASTGVRSVAELASSTQLTTASIAVNGIGGTKLIGLVELDQALDKVDCIPGVAASAVTPLSDASCPQDQEVLDANPPLGCQFQCA